MIRPLLIAFAVIALSMGFQGVALAIDCPPHPIQTGKDWEGEVNAAVAKIGPVSGGEVKTKAKAVTQDLLGKLPDAGKIYLEQMKYATICSSIRDDKALSESEKRKQMTEYESEFQRAIEHTSSEAKKPVVVLPAPKPTRKKKADGPQSSITQAERAYFAITKIWVTSGPDWPLVDDELSANFTFKNVGTGMAHNMHAFGRTALKPDTEGAPEIRTVC